MTASATSAHGANVIRNGGIQILNTWVQRWVFEYAHDRSNRPSSNEQDGEQGEPGVLPGIWAAGEATED